jgi:hypothetical protein
MLTSVLLDETHAEVAEADARGVAVAAGDPRVLRVVVPAATTADAVRPISGTWRETVLGTHRFTQGVNRLEGPLKFSQTSPSLVSFCGQTNPNGRKRVVCRIRSGGGRGSWGWRGVRGAPLGPRPGHILRIRAPGVTDTEKVCYSILVLSKGPHIRDFRERVLAEVCLEGGLRLLEIFFGGETEPSPSFLGEPSSALHGLDVIDTENRLVVFPKWESVLGLVEIPLSIGDKVVNVRHANPHRLKC